VRFSEGLVGTEDENETKKEKEKRRQFLFAVSFRGGWLVRRDDETRDDGRRGPGR